MKLVKRIFALCLAVLMVLPALHGNAQAAKGPLLTVAEQVALEAVQSFEMSCESAGRLSFHGYCALMVSHQLYNMKINKYLTINDGKNQFDYYAKRKKTTGGYSITPYYGELFTLREALDTLTSNGQRDVRNLLVGFEWTSTTEGSKYGHAIFVNGIIDGKVYYVESYDCYIKGKEYLEGQLICVSIEDFAEYYDRWTQFDGLVHFGSGTYEEVCPRKETAVYIRARFDAVLRSQPCVVGQWKCKELGTVKAGQRLLATALYQGDRGCYYRIKTDAGDAFITASAVSFMLADPEDLQLQNFQLGEIVVQGSNAGLSGTVMSRAGNLSAVEISVVNAEGVRAGYALTAAKGGPVELAPMNKSLQLEKLPAGWYTVEIYGEGGYAVAEGTEATDHYQRVLLDRSLLQVTNGNSDRQSGYMPELMQEALAPKGWVRVNGQWQFQTPPVEREGWVRENGKWFFYENGKPKTGWLTEMGMRYYFGPDGTMATGWQMVGNELRYFDLEGALVTNREIINGKRVYQLDEYGVAQFQGEVKESKKKK